MRDARLDRLADVLVRYSTRVKPGDWVVIASESVGYPLVEATFEAVLRAGGHPEWLVRSETLDELMLAEGSAEQIARLSPVSELVMDRVDVRIAFWADVNTRFLGAIDPKRVAARDASRRPLRKRFMERAAQGDVRWCGTLYPTEAAAQDAGMSLRAYADFVFRSGLLHEADPVAAWKAVKERQQRVCDFLQDKKELRFRVPATEHHDGTDLTVNVDPSKSVWINCAGEENFPDGEVFTGPQGVEGHVNYTYPAVYNGNEVEGVRLAFQGGRVVDASARKGEAFLIEMLDQDQGARSLGEIAIGTNYGITEFSKNTLFDEKIGGTFHAAVGSGYPESGSHNESGLHWDMVCELRERNGEPGGTIEADGEVFHRNGRFTDPSFPGPN
ncbi:MAG: aminopeptidase [Phycisphaerales bacterium]|nr:MAG: aminopeptidase [Phycisphaerales bacterium]